MVLSKEDLGYRQCAISVMDNIADPDIRFNEKGVCNYYYEYLEGEKNLTLKGEAADEKVKQVVKEMKSKAKGKTYDCILGVSGGVDSTFLAWKAKMLGLRVLCVHFDNGWNSELAVKNIENIISKCGFELYTYVINWDEFRDIQLSYFKAGVIDIEAVTDIAIFNALDVICEQFKTRYIIDGRNVVTEFTLPPSWINKNPNNLYQIHQRFGTLKLQHYPAKFKNGEYIANKGNFTSIPLLNYINYDKKEAKEIISSELGWKDYGGKHYESVFTRFYQGHILPEKFKVDKRKAHLSNLIFSGQITKQQALEELKQPIYPSEVLLGDKQFVLKKLGFNDQSFNEYLKSNPISHKYYGGKPVKTKKTLLAILRMRGGKLKQLLMQSKDDTV